jgi:hypothetical protein
MVDRTEPDCRQMLEVCGFTYDPMSDAFSNGGGRVLSVDTILAHTQLWVAQWITFSLPSGEDGTASSMPLAPGPARPLHRAHGS